MFRFRRKGVALVTSVGVAAGASVIGLLLTGALTRDAHSRVPDAKRVLLEEQIFQNGSNGLQNGNSAAHPAPVFRRSRWAVRSRPKDLLIGSAKPFPSSIYDLEALVWQHWQNGRLTVVYAGAFTEHPQQGFVIVMTMPYPLRVSTVPSARALDKPDGVRETLYRTPRPLRSVAIVAVHDGVLTLRPQRGGADLRFDVRQRLFT
jgi:hypothetical protein